MTEPLISPRALEILRLITPEWVKLDSYDMCKIPEMRELHLHGLIAYQYLSGEHFVKITPLASQFVPECFN